MKNAIEMEVIAISSGKGGVGKSLITACLGQVVNDGKMNLLVDCDIAVKGLTFMHGDVDFWTDTKDRYPGSFLDYVHGRYTAAEIIESAVERPGPVQAMRCSS